VLADLYRPNIVFQNHAKIAEAAWPDRQSCFVYDAVLITHVDDMHAVVGVKVGFHYPSSRAELTARDLGCIIWHPSTRVVETDLEAFSAVCLSMRLSVCTIKPKRLKQCNHQNFYRDSPSRFTSPRPTINITGRSKGQRSRSQDRKVKTHWWKRSRDQRATVRLSSAPPLLKSVQRLSRK